MKMKTPPSVTVQEETEPTAEAVRVVPVTVRPPDSSGNGLKIVLLCIIITLCVILSVAIRNREKAYAKQAGSVPVAPPVPSEPAAPTAAAPVATISPTVQQSYDAACAFYREHPADFAEARKRFEKIREVAAGSPGAELAEEMLRTIAADMNTRQTEILTELEAAARKKVEQGEVQDALVILRDYDGPLADETIRQRYRIASELSRKTVPEEPAEEPVNTPAQLRGGLNQGLNNLFAALRENKTAEAAIIAEDLAGRKAMCAIEPRLIQLHELVGDFANVDAAILKIVPQLEGKTLRLWDVDRESVTLRFKGVEHGLIVADRLIVEKGKVKGSMLVQIPPSGIHPKGYIEMLHESNLPYRDGLAALISWKEGQKDYARNLLEKSREATAPLLLVGLTRPS